MHATLVRQFLYADLNCRLGLYYDYKSGYYYDAEKGLYYDGNSGNYLSFDTESQAWRNQDEGVQRKCRHFQAADTDPCPDPAFHISTDPDPIPDRKLRSLVYGPWSEDLPWAI
jgi:hypothetical protein